MCVCVWYVIVLNRVRIVVCSSLVSSNTTCHVPFRAVSDPYSLTAFSHIIYMLMHITRVTCMVVGLSAYGSQDMS